MSSASSKSSPKSSVYDFCGRLRKQVTERPVHISVINHNNVKAEVSTSPGSTDKFPNYDSPIFSAKTEMFVPAAGKEVVVECSLARGGYMNKEDAIEPTQHLINSISFVGCKAKAYTTAYKTGDVTFYNPGVDFTVPIDELIPFMWQLHEYAREVMGPVYHRDADGAAAAAVAAPVQTVPSSDAFPTLPPTASADGWVQAGRTQASVPNSFAAKVASAAATPAHAPANVPIPLSTVPTDPLYVAMSDVAKTKAAVDAKASVIAVHQKKNNELQVQINRLQEQLSALQTSATQLGETISQENAALAVLQQHDFLAKQRLHALLGAYTAFPSTTTPPISVASATPAVAAASDEAPDAVPTPDAADTQRKWGADEQ